MVPLFQSLLQQGKLPDTWKIAKILPLKKPNKGNYLLPGAYHPISLLPTLSKALEYLVVQKLAHLCDAHDLLPGNHFGGLKCKNTLDALVVLQEKIYQAWRDKKVLSLITFYVQGAFNGMAKDVLFQRLQKRRIPEVFVSWIENFCSQRQATLSVNGESTNLTALEHAGLSQGSPLSPILFLFFNADLVQEPINKNKGSIAFIDNYTAWVTGDSIVSNMNALQAKIIPHLEGWAYDSGAIFNPEKTILIHFTRNKSKLTAEGAASAYIQFGQEIIKPKLEVKLLGVVFDQKLTYKHHIAKAAKRGIKAALALKRLKNLKPEITRQLFVSTVAPVVDYASPIWVPGATLSSLRTLDNL